MKDITCIRNYRQSRSRFRELAKYIVSAAILILSSSQKWSSLCLFFMSLFICLLEESSLSLRLKHHKSGGSDQLGVQPDFQYREFEDVCSTLLQHLYFALVKAEFLDHRFHRQWELKTLEASIKALDLDEQMQSPLEQLKPVEKPDIGKHAQGWQKKAEGFSTRINIRTAMLDLMSKRKNIQTKHETPKKAKIEPEPNATLDLVVTPSPQVLTSISLSQD